MKIIRWWGISAFAVLIILAAAIWFLLAPKLIASSIEEFGSEALGAKVDVARVELGLSPLTVGIFGLQAADPDKPMQNLLEVEEVTFAVDLDALLWKKIVIDELNLSGVKLATARAESGSLGGGRRSSQLVDQIVTIEMPELSEADLDAAVEKTDLITLKRIDEFKSRQADIESRWQNALDKEAFNARQEKLKREFQRLSKRAKKNKLNLIKDRKDWKKLKKAIDSERRQLTGLSDQLKQDRQLLSQQYQSVKQGPDDDLKAVMGQFGLGDGVDGLVDRYLGPKYTPWVKRAIEMAQGVQTNNSGQGAEQSGAAVLLGERVFFSDEKLFPDVLVKKMNVSGQDINWDLEGGGFNLGYLPWLTGKPAKIDLKFSGNSLAAIKIDSNWPSAEKMTTKLDAKINRWPLSELPLMETPEGSWLLSSAVLAANAQGNITLEKIDLVIDFSFSSVQLKLPENLIGWQKSLADSLARQSKINFKLVATGDLTDPKIKLSSGLDKLMQGAVGEQVKQKAEKLKDKVKQSISAKVGDIGDLSNFGDNLNQWQSQLSSNDSALKDLLGKIKI